MESKRPRVDGRFDWLGGLDQLFFLPLAMSRNALIKFPSLIVFGQRGEGPADILTTSIFKSLIAKSPPFSVLTGQSTKGDSH